MVCVVTGSLLCQYTSSPVGTSAGFGVGLPSSPMVIFVSEATPYVIGGPVLKNKILIIPISLNPCNTAIFFHRQPRKHSRELFLQQGICSHRLLFAVDHRVYLRDLGFEYPVRVGVNPDKYFLARLQFLDAMASRRTWISEPAGVFVVHAPTRPFAVAATAG